MRFCNATVMIWETSWLATFLEVKVYTVLARNTWCCLVHEHLKVGKTSARYVPR